MSITSVYPSINPYVGNPAVDLARRENQRRDVIEPVAQMERGAAEKGVISEDKSRNGSSSNIYTAEDNKNRQNELKQAIEGWQQNSDGQSSGEQSSGGQSSGQSDRRSGEQASDSQNSSSDKAQQQREQQQLAELKKRDAEVRAHEQAHASVGGSLAGAPSYEFETGPDGEKYAVGGEVQIDVSEVAGDPQATIAKMQQVRAAALAPAEPSGPDRQIANEAQQKLLKAQADLTQQNASATDLDSQPADDKQPSSGITAGAVTTSGEQDSRWQGVGQQRSLEVAALMQKRSAVIGQFYRSAVMPSERPLLLTA